MSRVLGIEFLGAVCHAVSRGNERKGVFRNDEDFPIAEVERVPSLDLRGAVG